MPTNLRFTETLAAVTHDQQRKGPPLDHRFVKVRMGLPASLLAQAARLYWQAFGSKLGRTLGPDAMAIAFLQDVIRCDHCLYATDDDGNLLGIAGFKSVYGSFVSPSLHDFRRHYGRFGGALRAMALRLLQSEIDNERFLVDGICVDPDVRGQGVGTELLHALIAEARWRGYSQVRLDVVDTNIRARALYERMGFSALRSETLGLLRHVFGFDRAITMVRDISRAAAT